jgi:hypothetical protein
MSGRKGFETKIKQKDKRNHWIGYLIDCISPLRARFYLKKPSVGKLIFPWKGIIFTVK